MSEQIAIGFSQAPDIQEAAQHACVAVKGQLNHPTTDLVIVFACSPYAGSEVLEIIHTILKPQRLIGSSTVGIMLSEGSFARGIAVLGINDPQLHFGITSTRVNTVDTGRDGGFEWARRINADCKTPHQACLMFSDFNLHNNSLFIRGIHEVLGLGFPVVGGISSEDLALRKTYQFYQKQVLTQSTVGLLMGGGHVAIGNKHGFKPLGKPRTITGAQNNVIHTIDDQPAMQIYEEYLGIEVRNFKPFSTYSFLYPLGIYLEEQRQYLLKNAIDILVDGSIVCQGEVPEGAEVHLMIGNRDTCRDSAIDAANQVKEALGGKQAKLIIVIESVGRYKIQKNNSDAEIQAIKEVLGYTTPIFGMYAFGEIGPLSQGHGINNTFMQNESILILAID